MINVARNMTAAQAVKASELFMQIPNVKHLRLSELKLFFREFMNGAYGKLYEGFGYNNLVDAFNQFFEERVNAIVEYRENEHLRKTDTPPRYRTEGDAFGNNTRPIGEIINNNNEQQKEVGD